MRVGEVAPSLDLFFQRWASITQPCFTIISGWAVVCSAQLWNITHAGPYAAAVGTVPTSALLLQRSVGVSRSGERAGD